MTIRSSRCVSAVSSPLSLLPYKLPASPALCWEMSGDSPRRGSGFSRCVWHSVVSCTGRPSLPSVLGLSPISFPGRIPEEPWAQAPLAGRSSGVFSAPGGCFLTTTTPSCAGLLLHAALSSWRMQRRHPRLLWVLFPGGGSL